MLKILIIEDSTSFRQSLKDVLTREFPLIQIAEAADAEEGLQDIQFKVPDLVLLDLHLPGTSGLELAKKLREDHPDMIIIILTSYDLEEYRNAAQKSGANHFFSKGTTTVKELLTVIHKFLSKSGLALDPSNLLGRYEIP